MDEQKDEKLWRIARKRAAFRKSLSSYLVINAFLWAIWWFMSGRHGDISWPWPIWPMLGWGLGIVFQYFEAYGGDKESLVEKEYEKLNRNRK